MGMTMAEKILSRAAGKQRVTPGEFVTARVDQMMAHDGSGQAWHEYLPEARIDKIARPDRVTILFDHNTPAHGPAPADLHKALRDAVKKYGIEHFYDMKAGVCHQIMPENGHIIPGELVLGTDSHSTTYGAFGAAGAGIGSTEMAYVMATGQLWMQVPPTLKFVLHGRLPSRVMAKDIALFIAGKYSTEVAQYKAIEFTGPAAEAMSIDSRMAMSNMGVELGAKFAFCEADEKTLKYLEGRARRPAGPFKADSDATYEQVYEVDVSDLEPQIACPHDVGNVRPISQMDEVKVDQASLGSCTGGRIEDLEMAAAIIKGRKIHPEVRMIVVPASREIYLEALRRGILETFVVAGAVVTNPGCCATAGRIGAGERCISAFNRNFKGRAGSPGGEIYLGSPATVAASAVAGKIVDPREL